jgi:hypothetical protein
MIILLFCSYDYNDCVYFYSVHRFPPSPFFFSTFAREGNLVHGLSVCCTICPFLLYLYLVQVPGEGKKKEKASKREFAYILGSYYGR